MRKPAFLALFLIIFTPSFAGFNAGVARKTITPDSSLWLSGYAGRNKPSTGVIHDLWAKAVIITEKNDIQLIIVTIDIIGLSHELSETISEKITKKHKIKRSQLLLNTSHTHSGPVIWPSLGVMYDLETSQLQALIRYSSKLADDIEELIDSALSVSQPVNLYLSHSSADFAINRRQVTEKGVVIGINNEGPVDWDVPVLKVETPDGIIKAVIFGYACHNTTLDGYEINGDYAGFAQLEIEKANKGVTAMFLAGCGADQNPNPRRSVEIAMQHGRTLAQAVQKALDAEFTPVSTPVRTDFLEISLEFAPFSPGQFKDEILGDNKYRMRRAANILTAMDKGYDVNKISYPVQAVRFNNDFTIVALGGEVVVDYSLKTKSLYPSENIFVAAYSNEVQCYIPSLRILKEGGYEPETSMIYYGLPGPLADNVEEKIFEAIARVMKRTGAGKK